MTRTVTVELNDDQAARLDKLATLTERPADSFLAEVFEAGLYFMELGLTTPLAKPWDPEKDGAGEAVPF